MKRTLVLFASFLFAVPAQAAPKPSVPLNIRLLQSGAGAPTGIRFDYDFTLPNNKPCSATLTKGCVQDFTFSVLQGTAAAPTATGPSITTPITIALPSTMSTTGVTVGIPCTNCIPTTLTYPGNYAACVNTNWRDTAEVVWASPQSCFLFGAPDPPQNVRPQ